MGDPRWVDAILDWPGTWLLARIGLTGAYILGGFVMAALLAEHEKRKLADPAY